MKRGVRGAFWLILVILNASAQQFFEIEIPFSASERPVPPDYSNPKSWAALPQMQDLADTIPVNSGLSDLQSEAKGDVFFIHPTIFTYEPSNSFLWNADVYDEDLNRKVDKSTIMNQATAFNGSCKVYAPRYRQAHYSAFTTSDKASAKAALDLAYSDVKSAFEFYLQEYNDGRPIVIASHSQGTVHAKRLIKEFFDGTERQSQLVEAYLIGIATKPDVFKNIEPSKTPNDIGGFVSWYTFAEGFYPPYYEDGLDEAVCTNPLTWRIDEEYADRTLNKGGVGLKFKFIENPVDAKVRDGMLWISKPHVRGRIFINTKIWHRADINLYWMNIRENVALRMSTFLTQNNTHGK